MYCHCYTNSLGRTTTHTTNYTLVLQDRFSNYVNLHCIHSLLSGFPSTPMRLMVDSSVPLNQLQSKLQLQSQSKLSQLNSERMQYASYICIAGFSSYFLAVAHEEKWELTKNTEAYMLGWMSSAELRIAYMARRPRVLYLIEPDCVPTVGVHGHPYGHDALDSWSEIKSEKDKQTLQPWHHHIQCTYWWCLL